MNRPVSIALSILLCGSLAWGSNPFASVSASTARQELKAVLENSLGSNYTAIEAMLDDGMKALAKLQAIPSNDINDRILSDQKKIYYPNFVMILAMYEQELAAYQRLNP